MLWQFATLAWVLLDQLKRHKWSGGPPVAATTGPGGPVAAWQVLYTQITCF